MSSWGTVSRLRLNDKSSDHKQWTASKLIKVAMQHHKELTALDKKGVPTDLRDIIKYDALGEVLTDLVEELTDRGYWVEGINDTVLIIEKNEEDEDE